MSVLQGPWKPTHIAAPMIIRVSTPKRANLRMILTSPIYYRFIDSADKLSQMPFLYEYRGKGSCQSTEKSSKFEGLELTKGDRMREMCRFLNRDRA